MSFEELSSPIPEIKHEDLPDIMAYSMLRNFVADLTPRGLSAGMEMWVEFRYRATGETNYPRWSRVMEIEGKEHTVGLFGVQGELPDGRNYMHSALRCNCCLPDYKSFTDYEEEYHNCPAQDAVIKARAQLFRQLVGSESLGQISDKSLMDALVFLVDYIRRTPMIFPPSNRSDRLLVDPLADVFDTSTSRVRAIVEGLADDNVVQLFEGSNPSISIAA